MAHARLNAKPENVIKRAEELVAVGQTRAALESLHEIIVSKRAKSTPLAVLEPIVLRFVDLAVELRRGKTAKDGLYVYKNIAQNSSVGSIEVVLKHFITLSEARVTEAQAQAERINLDSISDLEATETPESLLLATVSTEQSKDRTDRAVVTPWLKFLWEAYRTVLDILRNNARLEQTYQTTAHQAFNFCLRYERTTEFRRLCEILRNHLINANKYPNQVHAINLNDSDTLQRYLDTRFQQLGAAVKLGLYQEAFRSAEDIHTLLTMSKRPPRAMMMASYYELLAEIFHVADNHLFHAAAWSKLYSLRRDSNKLGSPAEHTQIASMVLLTALAIPVVGSKTKQAVIEMDDNKQKNARLSVLMGLPQMPTRQGLLKEALAFGALKIASPLTCKLYQILEVEFHPLIICKKIIPLFEELSQDPAMAKYIKALREVILTRLFQQLAQIYDTVKLDFVIRLASFDPSPFAISSTEIELFIMDICRKGELPIRIDHANNLLRFEADVFYSTRASGDPSVRLQATPSELVRTQLTRIASSLHTALNTVDPEYVLERIRAKEEAYARSIEHYQEEHVAIHNRMELIERRREMVKTLKAQKSQHEASERAERLRREQVVEEKRLMEDQRRREIERIQREQKRIREIEAKKFAEEMASKTNLGLDASQLAGLDTEGLRNLELQIVDKNAKELEERLRIVGKRLDHLERALRKEEIPLLGKDYEEQLVRERKVHALGRSARAAGAKAHHTEAVALKHRLLRLVDDYRQYSEAVEMRHEKDYQARRRKAEEAKEREKEARRQTYRQQVLEQRRAEREENERIAAEEARVRAEEEAQATAEAELKAKQEAELAARAEEKRKLDEQLRRQQERERAAEEKIAQKRNRYRQ